MRDINFLRSDRVSCPTFLRSMWARSKGQGFVVVADIQLTCCLAYLLLKLMTTNTGFVVLSFNF